MKRQFQRLAVLVCLFSLVISPANAQQQDSVPLNQVEKKCAIEKLWATAQHFRCLQHIRLEALKFGISEEEEASLRSLCEDRLTKGFERAEARGVKRGFECRTVGDASVVHQRGVDALPSINPLCPCFVDSGLKPPPGTETCLNKNTSGDNEFLNIVSRAGTVATFTEGTFEEKNVTLCSVSPETNFLCAVLSESTGAPAMCSDAHALDTGLLNTCNAVILDFVNKNNIQDCDE